MLPTSLTSDVDSTAAGGTATLTWSSAGANTCVASGGWSGALAASGTQLVNVTGAGSNYYWLTCASDIGDGSALTVVQGLLATVTVTASPTTVGIGQPTTLSWSTTSASTCTASGDWSGTLGSSGSQIVRPSTQGTHSYTLTCGNPGAPAQGGVAVNATVPTVSLFAYPSTVVTGKKVTLRWSGLYADNCVASGDWTGSLTTTGYKTFTAGNQGTQNFHISCSNAGASAGADATLKIDNAPASPPSTAYRINEQHNGVLLTANGVSYPSSSAPAWTTDLGASVSYPLIAGGMVFVTTNNPDGSYGNRLFALDAATGAKVWGPVAVPGVYFGSGLTYDNGRVFVLMFDGVLRAFNAMNGGALWTTQLPGYWYEASPNAYGGIVFTSGNGGLSAIDESTGSILWTNSSAGSTDWNSPSISSEAVYYATGNCSGGAYNLLDGSALWTAPNGCGYSWGYTSSLNSTTFFGRSGATLSLFDVASGAAKGQLASALAPAISDSALVAVNGGTLSLTDLTNLVQTWTFTGDGHFVTAPLIVNNTVFIGSSSGNVYGVDLMTGTQVWVGTAPVGINSDSENGGPMPPSGPSAGENLLIFPAGYSLVAWKLQ